MTYDIEHANILDWAESYTGDPFHAAMMDAPYEEEFMGKGWDNTGIAFNSETWKAIARHLHPGAFLFVFAGTLNDDLISVAMRQAGLRKYHRSGAWIYGSGFPKAAKLDTVIDRRAGVERTKIGTRKHQPKFDAAGHGYRQKDNGFNSKDRATFDVTKPATALAETWQPYRYGGQMLKPALESLLIFQKPVVGDMVTNITATGAGALWIDGGRIQTEDVYHYDRKGGSAIYQGGENVNVSADSNPLGRWPANFSLSHHPDCNGHCVPSCPVLRLGEQSGESESKASQRGAVNLGAFGGVVQGDYSQYDNGTERGHNDTGTAARFFHQADYVAERIEAADPVGYYAKASRTEREAGLDDMHARIMRDLYGSDDENEGEITPTINKFKSTGFDTTEIVMIQLSQYNQTEMEDKSWEKPGLEVMLQVDTVQSPPKVIGVSTTQYGDVSQWNMLLFGSNTTAPFLTGIKSTIVTKTNSITTSKTLSLLMRSLTSESIADANSDLMDGGNLAENAAISTPSISFTNREAVQLPGVGNVLSRTLWTISASAKLEVGADVFPRATINDGRPTPIDNPYQRGETTRRNVHPCIKPIALNRWIATLLLPPAHYGPRRLLVPFAGAGSEMIGAMLAGWEDVQGVELEQAHVEIARARIAFWQQMRYKLVNPDAPVKVTSAAPIPDGQTTLW